LSEKSNTEIIEELRNISGLSIEQLTTAFKAFSVYTCLSYLGKEKISISFFGNFYLKYDGDELTPKGKEAKVTGFFSPAEDLKRLIGQIEDAKNNPTKENYINITSMRYYLNMIEQIIRSEIE